MKSSGLLLKNSITFPLPLELMFINLDEAAHENAKASR
jgi:hypothetical protein